MTNFTIFAICLLILGVIFIFIGIVGLYRYPVKSKQRQSQKEQNKAPMNTTVSEKIRKDEEFKRRLQSITEQQKDAERWLHRKVSKLNFR